MLRVQDLSITRKLTLMNVLVSGTSLLLACAAFVVYELVAFRESLVRTLSIQAQIVGSNCASALLFNDRESAENTLAALKAAPNIISAGIYTLDGKPFAGYWRHRGPQAPPLPTLPEGQTDAHWFKDGQIGLVRPIVFQGKPTGVVYLGSDLKEMNDRVKRYAGIVAAVLSISFLATLLLSSRLRRAIADPIVHLAETVRTISRDKTYSVRVATTGNHDELATLIEAFNETLTQIQKREAGLQQLASIVTFSDDAIIGKTLEGTIVSWNAAAERMYGYSSEEVIGRSISLLVPPDRKDEVAEILQKLQRGESIHHHDTVRVRKDGQQIDVGLTISPIKDGDGNITGASTVARDITERKRAQDEVRRLNQSLERRVDERTAELEATNKELEAFTYSVSHDLRAPLRHIDGFSKILVEEFGPQLKSEARPYLQRIQEATRNMGRLVDDLLNLARLGRRPVNRQVTGLASVLQEVLTDLKPETEGRAIEWQIGELPFVEADPGLLKQVFSNLLSNAIKYTRPRQRSRIEVGQIAHNGQAAIFVRDNGVGFSMKYADKLFGIFQRLHRPEDFEGTGVGLATVQRIIHKHGGRIWAEAELDQGATFYFTVGPGEPSGAVVRPEREVRHGQSRS